MVLVASPDIYAKIDNMCFCIPGLTLCGSIWIKHNREGILSNKFIDVLNIRYNGALISIPMVPTFIHVQTDLTSHITCVCVWNIVGWIISQCRRYHMLLWLVNTLRPTPNCYPFADGIFFNPNMDISLKILLKFVPKFRINEIMTLVKIMLWRRSSDKTLSEPMKVSLPMHICVTRHQRVSSATKRPFFLLFPNRIHEMLGQLSESSRSWQYDTGSTI